MIKDAIRARLRAMRLAYRHPGRAFVVCRMPNGRTTVLSDWTVPYTGAEVITTCRRVR